MSKATKKNPNEKIIMTVSHGAKEAIKIRSSSHPVELIEVKEQ